MGYRNYSIAKGYIVAQDGSGDFSTIQSAIDAATVNQDIFIRPGTYTENITLKDNVNLNAFEGDQLGVVTIHGKVSYSGSSTVNLIGLNLRTNNDYAVQFSGSLGSFMQFIECNIVSDSANGILVTNSNSSSTIIFDTCFFTASSTFHSFDMMGAGELSIQESSMSSSNFPTAYNTVSNGTLASRYSELSAISFSGSASLTFFFTHINEVASSRTPLVFNTSTPGAGGYCYQCYFRSGSVPCITVNSTFTLELAMSTIDSLSTNAIDGTGIIKYGNLTFVNGNLIGTTTQNPFYSTYGIQKSTLQPCFMVYQTADIANATGDGTNFTIPFDTVRFNQSNSFSSGTFTSPVSGKYQLNAQCCFTNITAGHTYGNLKFIISSFGQIVTNVFNPAATRASDNSFTMTGSLIWNLGTGDTVQVQGQISSSTKTVGIRGTASSVMWTCFSGNLVC